MHVEQILPSIHGLSGGHMVRQKLDGGRTRIQGRCIRTFQLWSVVVLDHELLFYDTAPTSNFIRDAFPSLNLDGWEFLISGISPTGWKEIFGDE